MADADNTPSNLFFLAAATPALAASGDVNWDRLFGEYLRLDGLARADAAIGAYARGMEEFDLETARFTELHGKAYKTNEAAQPEWEAAWNALVAVERCRETTFLDPMWEAVRALALAPAPNLACALFKIELAKREDLHLDSQMPTDVMGLIIEDMARLTQGEA